VSDAATTPKAPVADRTAGGKIECVGTPLAERLHREIAERGPITFARFMETALYDEVDGFYAEPPVGADGHFLTSPHVSPVFGRLLARQLGEAFDLLGRPDPFHVVEFGAGDGTLARQILEAVADVASLAGSLRYVAVERSPGARRRLSEAGVESTPDAELSSGLTGVVVANELLDNLPFHLVRRAGSEVVEVFVGSEGEGFVFVPGPLSDPRLATAAGELANGVEAAVSLEAPAWLARAAAVLSRGYILVIDYGGSGPRSPQAYRAHRTALDVLRDPGSADITAGVDLDALAAAGRAHGLSVWGPVSQREALLTLGFGAYAEAERDRTAQDRDAGRSLSAARRWARRSRESLLVDPAALGGLQVMVFGVGTERPLACVRGQAG
jgi:SAM-dependent MidA family methyltransferase